jgi:hypothetical protein
MDREAQLEAWIAQTRRLQRRLVIVFSVLGAIALGLTVWHTNLGALALVLVALVAICSFWITEAHNAAHRAKLAELRELARTRGKPPATGHRRWQR